MALIVATIILCDRSCREAVFVMVVGGGGGCDRGYVGGEGGGRGVEVKGWQEINSAVVDADRS